MTELTLKTFETHKKELMQDPEFAAGYEEQRRLMGIAMEVAKLRAKQGLSQTELAERSGITQQQLSKLERGENCNLSTFLKVCISLGMEVKLKRGSYSAS